jgi:MOSC domain-containing protein YiiM
VASAAILIQHLYVSPGHNFFGHHGRPPSEHPIHEVEEIRCLTGRGVEGDRFLDYKDNYKGQITLFEEEVFHALCRELGIYDRSPAALRRNVVTKGVELNSLIGQDFELQGVRLSGAEECRPCYWMNQSFGPGAEEALKGRGGLRARILCDGVLRVNH